MRRKLTNFSSGTFSIRFPEGIRPMQLITPQQRRQPRFSAPAWNQSRPMSLRETPQTARGHEYCGVLPQAVRRFSSKLPAAERSLLKSREMAFVDYLLDKVVSGVEAPLNLIERTRISNSITK